MFPQPDQFDPQRPNLSQHVAFGRGVHYCPGAPLAQLEGRIALELLTQRLPKLRMQPGQTLDYTPNLTFRGPYELFVEWDAPPEAHKGGATL